MGEKKKADWEAIERDYRTGKFSDQELADKHGNVVTRQAISKKAKEKGWQKDLTTAVRQATRAKVIAAEVAKRVDKEVAETVAGNVAKSCEATTDAVLAAAEVNKQVILRHRDDIAEAREVSLAMLNELKVATLDPEKLHALFDKLTEDMDPVGRTLLAQRFNDVMKIHARVGSMHKLADTLSKLQGLERKAFSLDDEEPDKGSTFEEVLAEVASELPPA